MFDLKVGEYGWCADFSVEDIFSLAAEGSKLKISQKFKLLLSETKLNRIFDKEFLLHNTPNIDLYITIVSKRL